jgi:hypothetical protein
VGRISEGTVSRSGRLEDPPLPKAVRKIVDWQGSHFRGVAPDRRHLFKFSKWSRQNTFAHVNIDSTSRKPPR